MARFSILELGTASVSPASLPLKKRLKTITHLALELVGIISIILQCPPSTYEPFRDTLLSTISFILSVQTPSGDIPRGYPTSDWTRYTVYWCHGAGGLTQFLSLLLRLDAVGSLPLGDQRAEAVRVALVRAAEAVWERGLIRKGTLAPSPTPPRKS